jgi:enoyl-CoA hydratase/carnithine racemase
MGATLELTVADGIAWLTLNRPEKLNALDRATVRALAEALDVVRERGDVRVVVTRGAGRAFCAGSDLADLAPLAPAEAASVEREHSDACARFDRLPQPTVAALHGYVLGGGLGLALYHDFRIAAESAVLGMPEVELGWTPPWAMGRLVDVVGPAHARWLAIACARVSASEAKSLGLVNDLVSDDELDDRVSALARRLAELPPTAVRETKALILRMSPLRRPEWDAAAAEAFERCYGTAQARANVEAFLKRRKKRR